MNLQTLPKRTFSITILALLLLALTTAVASADAPAVYEVTITNLTTGQPFTPPAVVTHRQAVDLFNVGDPASEGIKEIAENGNLAPLLDAVNNAKHVSDVVVATGDIPPLLPNTSVTF